MAVKKKMAHGEEGVIKFSDLMLADNLREILDIGCGIEQTHVAYMRKRNLNAIGIDVLEGPMYRGNYNMYKFDEQFEGIHAAHVLEHQPNPNLFLKKVNSDLIEGGYLCITVPPMKPQIVGGHVTLWNAGLVLYHLVLAGFDCVNAHILTYGYNISVIVKKKSIDLNYLEPLLVYDSPDLNTIHPYLPQEFNYGKLKNKTFGGDIKRRNW
jgi:SAM-dependent methyltransferase